MKKIFKLSNLIPLLLVVYITKSFITEPTYFDFGVIFLMSISFVKKLSMDKEIISDKEDLKAIISQLEENVNSKYDELKKMQDNDRLAADNKFSTLNLGVQRQSKQQKDKTYNGWG